jgi:hypothetical protein
MFGAMVVCSVYLCSSLRGTLYVFKVEFLAEYHLLPVILEFTYVYPRLASLRRLLHDLQPFDPYTYVENSF